MAHSERLQSGSDTGSIAVQRVESGQIVYIESEDKLIKVRVATVNWSDFTFRGGGGAMGTGVFDWFNVFNNTRPTSNRFVES